MRRNPVLAEALRCVLERLKADPSTDPEFLALTQKLVDGAPMSREEIKDSLKILERAMKKERTP